MKTLIDKKTEPIFLEINDKEIQLAGESTTTGVIMTEAEFDSIYSKWEQAIKDGRQVQVLWTNPSESNGTKYKTLWYLMGQPSVWPNEEIPDNARTIIVGNCIEMYNQLEDDGSFKFITDYLGEPEVLGWALMDETLPDGTEVKILEEII